MDSWTEFKELKSLEKLDEFADSLPPTQRNRLYQTVLEIAEQIAREGKVSGAGGLQVDNYLKQQLKELKLRANFHYD